MMKTIQKVSNIPQTAPNPPKTSPNPPQDRPNTGQNHPKTGLRPPPDPPRAPQDDPNTDPRPLLEPITVLHRFQVRFGGEFGANLAPFWEPKRIQNRPKIDRKMVSKFKSEKMPPGADLGQS